MVSLRDMSKVFYFVLVRLEEEPDLQLPFLLPEDGYSCDIVKGVPNGLTEFLDPIIHTGEL